MGRAPKHAARFTVANRYFNSNPVVSESSCFHQVDNPIRLGSLLLFPEIPGLSEAHVVPGLLVAVLMAAVPFFEAYRNCSRSRLPGKKHADRPSCSRDKRAKNPT